MKSYPFTGFVIEEAALAWPEVLGHAMLHNPVIAFGEPAAEQNFAMHRLLGDIHDQLVAGLDIPSLQDLNANQDMATEGAHAL